jgi:selenocysteine lyase/cysteine desulfurase
VRASFHFYNNDDDVETFIAAMKELRGSYAPRTRNTQTGT